MKTFATIAILMLAACSTQVPPYEGVFLECHYYRCPSPADVQRAADIFADFVPEADLNQVVIQWWPPETVFDIRFDEFGNQTLVVAETLNDSETRLWSYAAIPDELMHIHYWRAGGDPDRNHETPPGPWTNAANDLIEKVKAEYAKEGLTP